MVGFLIFLLKIILLKIAVSTADWPLKEYIFDATLAIGCISLVSAG